MGISPGVASFSESCCRLPAIFTSMNGKENFASTDVHFCRQALHIALRSQQNGNLPFGCLLVGPEEQVLLEAENTVVTSGDAIAHCEINLVHGFAGKYSFEYLNRCTVYASTEPCPMCSAALFWSGVGKLVYAVSKEGYKKVSGDHNPIHSFPIGSKDLLAKGGRKIEVTGPVLEEEGSAFYRSLRLQK